MDILTLMNVSVHEHQDTYRGTEQGSAGRLVQSHVPQDPSP